MRRSVLVLFVFISALTACGGANRSERAAGVASSENSNVSFGLYDISSGSGMSGLANVLTSKPGGDEKPVSRDLVASQPSNTSENTSTNDRSAQPPFDRKVIRNADLDLEAETPEETQHKITAIAESNGGFVVESSQSSSDLQSAARDFVSMTIRVPAEKFEKALDEIRNAGGRVVSENLKGQDVTEEFIDIDARLKAKKALEAQFMDIMKRASSIQEALNVQGQLAEVRTDIEKIEGRKRFLENQSSLSTIKVQVQTPRVFAANSQGFSGRLGDSFETGLGVAMNFILGLVTFFVAVFPFALFIGLPSAFVFRYFWKRQTRPKSVSEIARDEIS
jgi:hypothetical protein